MKSGIITSLGFRRVASISPQTSAGDVNANITEIIKWCERATSEGADFIVLPELCITGYAIGDLVRLPDLLSDALNGLEILRKWTTGKTPVVFAGLPLEVNSRIYNVGAALHDAHILAVVPKSYLPSTHEYYDLRWFASGSDIAGQTIRIANSDVPFGTDILIQDAKDASLVCGIEICEDVWAVEPPSLAMARAGATMIVNLSASNELVGKAPYRRSLIVQQSARTYSCYAYSSAGPGESTTDMVFSGHCIIAESGEILAESDRLVMEGSMVLADADLRHCVQERLNGQSFKQGPPTRAFRRVSRPLEISAKSDVKRSLSPMPFVPFDASDRSERCMEIVRMQATALAVRMNHMGTKRMVLGLSGGLDSTLAALVCEEACELLAVPHTQMLFVTMPGMGTSVRTRNNADRLAKSLGAELRSIDISKSVHQHFADISHDDNDTSIVYENAQARERTQILMDIANSAGGLVVGTGDLSELALGWSTYNADHMSMYNVNAGVPKTLVRHLIEWFAQSKADAETRDVLRDILDTPISPELLPPTDEGIIAQRTEEMIGPFELHDFYLFHLIRLEEPVRKVAILACLAFRDKYTNEQVVQWLEVFIKRFFTHQFKRSCMPDGLKIGSVALSPRADWRMPSDAKPQTWLNQLSDIALEILSRN